MKKASKAWRLPVLLSLLTILSFNFFIPEAIAGDSLRIKYSKAVYKLGFIPTDLPLTSELEAGDFLLLRHSLKSYVRYFGIGHAKPLSPFVRFWNKSKFDPYTEADIGKLEVTIDSEGNVKSSFLNRTDIFRKALEVNNERQQQQRQQSEKETAEKVAADKKATRIRLIETALQNPPNNTNVAYTPQDIQNFLKLIEDSDTEKQETAGSDTQKQETAGSDTEKQKMAESDTEKQKMAKSGTEKQKMAGSGTEKRETAGSDTQKQEMAESDTEKQKMAGVPYVEESHAIPLSLTLEHLSEAEVAALIPTEALTANLNLRSSKSKNYAVAFTGMTQKEIPKGILKNELSNLVKRCQELKDRSKDNNIEPSKYIKLSVEEKKKYTDLPSFDCYHFKNAIKSHQQYDSKFDGDRIKKAYLVIPYRVYYANGANVVLEENSEFESGVSVAPTASPETNASLSTRNVNKETIALPSEFPEPMAVGFEPIYLEITEDENDSLNFTFESKY